MPVLGEDGHHYQPRVPGSSSAKTGRQLRRVLVSSSDAINAKPEHVGLLWRGLAVTTKLDVCMHIRVLRTLCCCVQDHSYPVLRPVSVSQRCMPRERPWSGRT